MTPLLVAPPGNEALAARLASVLGAEIADVKFHRFPDEESYLRILTPVTVRPAIIVCTLNRPDEKFLRLAFAAAILRELGATQVGLVAPYLAYVRQDRRFQPGEALTSATFAKLISGLADWLITIAPHLHRLSSLSSIYDIPVRNVHAAAIIADWIKASVTLPLLVGPDSESAQWVSEVATLAGAPFIVPEKTRHSDTDVDVSIPEVARWRGYSPILVDDIISRAHTMTATLRHLQHAGMKPAICFGVHAVFAPGAREALLKTRCSRIVTTNSTTHDTNAIDVTPILAAAISEMLPCAR